MDETAVRIQRHPSVELRLIGAHDVRVILDLQLEGADLETRRRPGLVVGGADDHGQERVTRTRGRTNPAGQVDLGALTGAERGQIERPASVLRAIDGQ